MRVATGALREGLLIDLVGRIRHKDVRGRTVEGLVKRYVVDQNHAARIQASALACLAQVAENWFPDNGTAEPLLRWAALVHEVGLGIAHSQYHKHGAYVLEHADLPGFSRQEQQLLAVLVRSHRGKFPVSVFKALPQRWIKKMQRLAVLLRLAVVLHRSRSPVPLPELALQADKRALTVGFPAGWLDAHPLTRADLDREASYLKVIDFELQYR